MPSLISCLLRFALLIVEFAEAMVGAAMMKQHDYKKFICFGGLFHFSSLIN